jgi:hypothetical protein
MSVAVPWQSGLPLFFEATTFPGISGVGQCALGTKLALRPHGAERWLDATEAAVLWFGFYGKPLLERGRQPYNQTSPAAYMPLALSDFDVLQFPSGALLVQRQASRARLNQPVHDGGGGHHEARLLETPEKAQLAVEQFLQSMGIDGVTASTYAEQILRRLLDGYAHLLKPSGPQQSAAPSA